MNSRLISVFIFLFLPGLATSQSLDVTMSNKYAGKVYVHNSRAVEFSSITIDIRKSSWSASVSLDAYQFLDEAAIVAYYYTPALVNKLPGNRYDLNYVTASGGVSLPFLKYFRYEGGFSASVLLSSDIDGLPYFNFQTGYLEDQYYDLSQSELYFSNTNFKENNWNLSPLIVGVYQRVFAKIPVFKQIHLAGSVEFQRFITPMIQNDTIGSNFFDGNWVGVESLFLVSVGVGCAF